jgi:uncharacterized protein (DUF3820 family)
MAYEAKKPEPLKDDSIMPTGKHKGEKMINVPANYLMHIYDSGMCNNLVKVYIESNLDVIRQQAIKDGYSS